MAQEGEVERRLQGSAGEGALSEMSAIPMAAENTVNVAETVGSARTVDCQCKKRACQCGKQQRLDVISNKYSREYDKMAICKLLQTIACTVLDCVGLQGLAILALIHQRIASPELSCRCRSRN